MRLKKMKNKKGQSIVELALLLPVILMLLLGIVEFGRVYGAYMVITNASRQGARVGAVGGDDVAIGDAVKDSANTLDQGALLWIPTRSGEGGVGETITVTVTYDIQLYAPFIGSFTGNPIHMEAATSMRIE